VLAKQWKKSAEAFNAKEQGEVIFFSGNKKLDQTILINENVVYKNVQLKLGHFPGKKWGFEVVEVDFPHWAPILKKISTSKNILATIDDRR
jgi:hypothetical protein